MGNKSAEQMVDLPVVLSKKVDGIIYNLMARTVTDQVFEGKYSLTEVLVKIRKSIDGKASDKEFHELVHQLEEFFNSDEPMVQTLADIHYYIQSCKDADAALREILNKKVDEELFTEETRVLKESIENVKTVLNQTLVDKYVTKEELTQSIETKLTNYVTTETFTQQMETVSGKIENCVTQETLTKQLETLETEIRETVKNTMVSSEGDEAPDDLVDGGFWVQIIN